MTSSLLLQQCPTCPVRLIFIVFVMGGMWPYSCCFVGCCLLDLFNIARSILVLLPSSFFSIHLVSVHVVHPYSSINTTATWKKLCFSSFSLACKLKRNNVNDSQNIYPSFTVSCILKNPMYNIMLGAGGDPLAFVMDCNIVVSEFKLRSRYCVHFRTVVYRSHWTNNEKTR